MKKKLLICVIFIFVFIVVYININNHIDNENIYFAINVDGESVSAIPSKGDYDVDINCENVYGNWNYNNWTIELENITDNVSCDLSFTSSTYEYFNNYIINLSGTNQGDGMLVEENGYRYEGADPSNYISFNNEIWRIIGVFDETSHGITGENLVKIIRTESIGGLVWSGNNVNDWNNSNLKQILNNEYYNAQNGTSSVNCLGYGISLKTNCNYEYKGIQSGYRELIQEVTWFLGEVGPTMPLSTVYQQERSETVYTGRPISGTGKVGLMYASDYGYSVLSSVCPRTTSMASYNYTCYKDAWLYKNGIGWTISPTSHYSALAIVYTGAAYFEHGNSGLNVNPVVYLKSNVVKIDGLGTYDDPYVIK